MSHKSVHELVAALLFILLLFGFFDPFKTVMSSSVQMMQLLALIVIFAVFASYVWKERERDEREAYLKLLAGRWAFLVGAGVLVIGIVVQSFAHALDQWLVIALGAMVVAKIVGLMSAERRH